MSFIWKQPIKGIWITILSILLTWATYLFMVEFAKCTLDAFMAWICVAFSVMWITGFSLQRWPASKIEKHLIIVNCSYCFSNIYDYYRRFCNVWSYI